MRVLLTICLLLISVSASASAQPRAVASRQEADYRRQTAGSRRQAAGSRKQTAGSRKQTAGSRIQAPARKAFLTRSQTKEAERWLTVMGYWTGPVDGVLDAGTRAALIAFQKWEGRPVTGRLTIDELEAIRTSADSKEAWPRAREVGYSHVEVDLDRQVLLIVNRESDDSTALSSRSLESHHSVARSLGPTDTVRVLPVSTGHGNEFSDEGQTSVAYTPRGRFVVYDKTFGWENGALGSVYYANYISGGVAIHGSLNVPAQPASHGCIRIPMFAARKVSKLLQVGTIVLVYDKVSFVSAKDWVANPELKQAALLESVATSADYAEYNKPIKSGSRSLVIKKARSKVIRA